MNKRLGRSTLVGLIAVIGCMAVPALASATGMYPAGASYTIPPTAVSIAMPGGAPVVCTFQMGANVPAAPNNSVAGTLTFNIAQRPTFTACSQYVGHNVTVTTSGTWTQSLTWGSIFPAASINVPANGITINLPSVGLSGTNLTAGSMTGTWMNGIPTPLQKSVMTVWGGPMIKWTHSSGPVNYPLNMSNTTFTINTGAPGGLITVTQN